MTVAMISAFACALVVAIAYRARRDGFGPPLTRRARVVAWCSLGTIPLWVIGDLVSGSDDRWFTSATGAGLFAAVQVLSLAVMTFDWWRSAAASRGQSQ